MRFMNEWDIEENAQRFARHPIKGKACRILRDLMNVTDQVSDGWPYWPAPIRSAAKLMALIKDAENPSEADLRKALAPIKAMFTRKATVFAGHTLDLATG